MNTKTIIGILVVLVMSLCGWLYIGLCDEDKRLNADKANNAAVMRTLDMMEKQRVEDRKDRKENLAKQEKINRQNDLKFHETQMIILKIVQDSGGSNGG